MAKSPHSSVAPQHPPRPWIGRRALRVAIRFLTEASYRRSALIRAEHPAGLFQPDNHTTDDRYPELFEFAANALKALKAPQVLSFGCSTGEEVFSLRRHLPNATVKGVDISRWNIAAARKRLRAAPDIQIEFERTGSTALEPDGKYDAIFCMAVFRHGRLGAEQRRRCDPLLQFSNFEAAVTDIARCLRPGGLLFIKNSNFRFRDTAASRGFVTVVSEVVPEAENPDPIYGVDNTRIDRVESLEVGFRKQAIDPL